MKKSLDEMKPDLVILIDYAGFQSSHSLLQPSAKKRNIKIFYYISPQVWAWRKGRINQIKKFVNKMAVILPFEVDTYTQKGFAVDYVGHPLLDLVKTRIFQTGIARKFDLVKVKQQLAFYRAAGRRKS